ncbi:MAG: ABC transporter ATP-binding protein [Elusimicrobia bacterium]|nr:ABC transporter ATP-binding protein [Elusimicrobiota bacterium]
MTATGAFPCVPAAAADRLGVRFGSFTALDGVSFTVPAASITGLVGPNGAGKTTLLRVLATLLPPSSGSASIGGLDVAGRAEEIRKTIGYLPDFAGIYQDMRVVEYLEFFAATYSLGRTETQKYIASALEISGLAGRAQSFIEELSRGMRAKLSFVRTLAGNPKLLLLDEPLSNLDPLARSELLAVIAGMRAGGKSVLISSHQLGEIEKLCDRVLFLDKGRLLEESRETTAFYSLRLANPEADAAALIGGIQGVASVTPSEGGRYLLRLGTGADPAEVLRGIVVAGPAVLEWRPLIPSLEERLIRAVRGGEA